MAIDRLQLQVILDMADKASGPLKKIGGTSGELARKLSEAEGALKKLQNQQRSFARVRELQQQFSENSKALDKAKADYEIYLGVVKQGGVAAKGVGKQYREAQERVTALSAEHKKLTENLLKMRQALTQAGVKNLSADEARLAEKIKQVNGQLERQKPRLEAIARLNEKHNRQMMRVGMIAGVGYAALNAGRRAARAGGSVVDAWSAEEDARGNLKTGLMRADGSVDPAYEQLLGLAKSLGGELSGSTAEFTDMLTALSRQGMSTQTILGGAGKAAAYLAERLQMPAAEAAEFAAKLQKATGAKGADAMTMADLIQRAAGMGVAPQSLQGAMTNAAPARRSLGLKGADAMRAMMPILVQMEQAGMGGEAAGKSLRKAIAASLNRDNVAKASQLAGMRLDFTDGKGKFGGIEQMYAQLAKIRHLSDARRAQVLRLLYGDNPVIAAMMTKGVTAYRQVADKLARQASLEQRVQAQQQNFSRLWKSVKETFADVLTALGETVGDDLKKFAQWLREAGAWLVKFIQNNRGLVRVLTLSAMVVIGLVTAFGALAVAYASVAAPMMIARFFMARFAVSMVGAQAASWGLLPALKGLASGIFGIARAGLAFLATPLGLALGLLALAAYLVWRNWDGIKGGLKAIWDNLTECVQEFLDSPVKGLARLAMLPVTVLEYLAGMTSILFENIADMKIPFISAGAEFIAGILAGFASKAKALKDGVINLASNTANWFKEKLGISSPSKVFMEFGGFIGRGAALGIERSAQFARRAALALAAATMAPVGMAATGMPALQSPAAAAGAQAGAGGAASVAGSSYSITINAQPGMDPQAIARAVRAELDRREREQRSRVLGSLSDVE